MVDVAIIDYGMGNLRSVEQAFHVVAPEAQVEITRDEQVIKQADRVVFPGQGAMPDCMRELDATGLRRAVLSAAAEKPFLGICIGLQMLFEHSEEGDTAGLGVLSGDVRRFSGGMTYQGQRLKVPHMGWNQVWHRSEVPHPLWQGIESGSRFYYVHSYYVVPAEPERVQACSDYPDPFVGAVARDNIFAVQFHPEKSHTAGLKLLENFVRWNI